ncbi:MAG: hypothetical protein AUJ51_04990 [Elusimicrobia bacterium CG1_02_56_21]|nr:MAG: hypothetical protein AUJ51_04990 [Elusimicrobia bacterium CG1_02_56_21]
MMKIFLLIMAVILCAGAARAGDGGADPYALATGKESARTLRDFKIYVVVDAVTAAMAEAARNYYLPDKTENSRAIASYNKEAKFLLSHDSTFRRSLAEICGGLANTAVKAVNQEDERLPGKPLTLPVEQNYEPYDEGLSSITVTEGEMTVVYTNTMPCINAAGRALNSGVRVQYMPGAQEGSPEREYYGSGAAAIMSSDRLYNHALSGVCAKLVRAARRAAEAKTGGKHR